MQRLTPAADQAIQNLAQRYRISEDAVRTMLFAVSAGGGTMAQFYHSELGGGGQWMRGGMTMVGDMFNHGLQATVNNLCNDLSNLLASQSVFAPPDPLPAPMGGSYQSQGSGGFNQFNTGNWWPSELGSPGSSGGQNDVQYAIFPYARRLAIRRNGQVTVYDTGDHQIGGVQQQQGGASGSMDFSSQFGTYAMNSLPVVSPGGQQVQQPVQYQQPVQAQQPVQYQQPVVQAQPAFAPASSTTSGGQAMSRDEILGTLERLGDLRQKGILSDDEFNQKKIELLNRL
jgi:hypothetical protein